MFVGGEGRRQSAQAVCARAPAAYKAKALSADCSSTRSSVHGSKHKCQWANTYTDDL